MRRLQYLDFELRIERDGDAYRARVLRSPAGEATHSFELPLTRDRIELIIMKLGQARRRATTRAGSKSTELSAARESLSPPSAQLMQTVAGAIRDDAFRAACLHLTDRHDDANSVLKRAASRLESLASGRVDWRTRAVAEASVFPIPVEGILLPMMFAQPRKGWWYSTIATAGTRAAPKVPQPKAPRSAIKRSL